VTTPKPGVSATVDWVVVVVVVVGVVEVAVRVVAVVVPFSGLVVGSRLGASA
jgi:hypothetical protein